MPALIRWCGTADVADLPVACECALAAWPLRLDLIREVPPLTSAGVSAVSSPAKRARREFNDDMIDSPFVAVKSLPLAPK
jgi:hypothetical protein